MAKLFMPRRFGGRPKLSSILIAVSFLALSSCGGGDGGTGAVAVTDCLNSSDLTPATSSPNQSNERITILNDEAELDKLITCKNETIAYGTSSAKAAKPGQAGGTARLVVKVFSLTLIAEVPPPQIVGKAAAMPGGVALDDLISGGSYTGTQHPYDLYRVEIDGTNPDTFQWSDDDGATWQSTFQAVTAGVPQTLSNGVTVTFAADTGHTVGDYWNIAAGILQATSVSMIADKKAVVSYNMVDAPYLGAIQVYKLAGDTAFLKSQALFNDMDVNAVSVSNKSDVYAVGSHEPAVKSAVLDWLKLNDTKLELPTPPQGITLPIELHSFAANSVIHDTNNNKIYVTDGNDGGLTVIDDATLLEDSHTALADARWVEMEGTTAVVMQGGNADGADGQISVYDITGGVPTFSDQFGFTGADIIESKSTVEVVGGKAFIAAGSGGARIISAGTGTSLAAIPIPTEAESGIPDPDNRVANAVSVDDDLMFISFGGAGVYVAQETSGKKFDEIGSEGPVTVSLLGKLQLVIPVDDPVSVNHVAYKGDYLFIAAGLGGLKIVRVDNY